MIKFVVTSIKKDGSRQLAFDNNGHNSYDTWELAKEKKDNVINNNSEERVLDLVGKNLEVTPVDCYPGGDAKRTYFAVENKFNQMAIKEHNGYKIGHIREEGKRFVMLKGFSIDSNNMIWGHWQFILKKTLRPSGKSTSFLLPIPTE